MIEILGLILFLLLMVFLGLSFAYVINRQFSLKPRKQEMIERFQQLESEITLSITNYQCYETGHESVWLEANYDEFKKYILDSYDTGRYDNATYFQEFLYKLEEPENKIYFSSAQFGEGLDHYDWHRLMHHEEWVSQFSPIKQKIDEFNTQRRKKSKNARWWEFWKIDDFE